MRVRRGRDEGPAVEKQLDEAERMLDILDALAIVLERPRELLELVPAAADAEDARLRLQETFGLSAIQATAALDLQVRRWTTLDHAKIVEQRDELVALVAALRARLSGA